MSGWLHRDKLSKHWTQQKCIAWSRMQMKQEMCTIPDKVFEISNSSNWPTTENIFTVHLYWDIFLLIDSSQKMLWILSFRYELTPVAKKVYKSKSANGENYDISDLNSEDSTDEEDKPRKRIPSWAEGQLSSSMKKYYFVLYLHVQAAIWWW